MAIAVRRYRQEGPSDADLADQVQSGATAIAFAAGCADIQFDDATSGIEATLDDFMASLGYAFEVGTPPTATSLQLRSPNGTVFALTVDDAGRLDNALGFGTVDHPARSFNTTFQPSATRPVLCLYSVRIASTLSLAGGQGGRAELVSDAAAPPTVVQSRVAGSSTGTAVIGLAITDVVEAVLVYLVPPGHNVRINTINEVGVPTFSLGRVTEITL